MVLAHQRHSLVTKGLPPGYTLDKVYLLKMPCCTCTQVVCRKEDGQSISIFEHDADQPVWFGRRPTVECRCHDMPTSVVQVGDRLAATWKNGQRYVTIIGANDLKEVTDFVAYLSGMNTGPGCRWLFALPHCSSRTAAIRKFFQALAEPTCSSHNRCRRPTPLI